ncbi:hypothetical protein H1R20_g7831, partial [Candolleomyces eurysporus]
MDFLKAEIAAKRKVLDEDSTTISARPNKYMRRGDLERLKEEQERKAQEEKRKQEEDSKRKEAEARAAEQQARRDAAAAKSKSISSSASPSESPGPLASEQEGADAQQPKESQFNISNEETIRRLRSKGQPIRLFGESDKERRLRLRALELIEEKDHERIGGQNDFKKALEDVENIERQMHSKGSKKKGKDGSDATDSVLDLDLVKTDPDKLYPIIYYALKRILKEWGESMDERPIEVKQSRLGKLAAATQSLPSDMLARIAEIVHHVQKRQYQRANDSYLRLSIGNAPWPIGVTMVGIHERSAREKISADQVAHVLNDEVSRKYIQSLKRLITFSQTKYPPADISQLMG